jgi:hypothetical protein
MLGRCIHQVPVVDEPGALDVEVIDPPLKGRPAASVGADQDEQRQESRLMDGILEQQGGLREGKRLVVLGQIPDIRDTEAHKQIPCAVLARGCLEEPLDGLRPFRIMESLQPAADP